jgi:hypothetical protein
MLDKKGKEIPVFKVVRCAYPACSNNATGSETGTPLCKKHFDILDFVVWALQSIKIPNANETKSGIILPK